MFGSTSSNRKSAEKAIAAAEQKAAKAADKVDERTDKATKKAVKAQEKADKQQAKADKADKKAVKKAPAPGLIGTLTDPKTARRAIAVVRMVGPVAAPAALRVATEVRGYLDERKATRLGVPAEEVALYRGPTGAVQARIATLSTALDDLRSRRSGDLQAIRFADVTRTRLGDLRAAVKASAAMPAGRRRSTLQAVSKELTRIESDLMGLLVARTA